MAVPVVQVRVMSVAMNHRCVPMPVAVRLTRRDVRRMLMLVMAVMDMAMLMLERLVHMLMPVRFGQVQPNPDRHQDPSDDKRHGDGFAEHRHRQKRAEERGGREIGA